MKVFKIKNLRAIVALASTLVLAISFGMARPIMAIADNRLPNEQSTANWPDTNGEQLATSKYDKKETLDFSTDYVFPKDYLYIQEKRNTCSENRNGYHTFCR